MKHVALAIALCHAFLLEARAAAPALRDGDIIFQTSRSAQSATFEGRPYDLYFEWSDGRIYCSELVWKTYQRALGVELGKLQKLREFDLTDAAVRAKMRQRYGSDVPLDEPVISPGAQFDSPALETVETR